MVKKMLFGLFACVLTGAVLLSGCKSSSPLVPASAAALNLVIPSRILNAKPVSKAGTGVTASTVPDSNEGVLEYYLSADGEAPVTGTITFGSGSAVGNALINLPKAGNWLVAAEWFYVYNTPPGSKKPGAMAVGGFNYAIPEFAGAGEVNVQGTTSFTLNMADIGYSPYSSCYTDTLTDIADCDYPTYYIDLYSFNSGVNSASVSAGTGDIQALYDPVTTNSTYLGSPTGASFAYLGNGDLINFPVLPSNATFYPNSIAAKGGSGASAVTLNNNDIFAVKVPANNAMVWLDVQAVSPIAPCTTPGVNSSVLQFDYVYNNENLNYMKFDQTANGQANCSVPTYTPTPLPTPTYAP